jgi:hypothetical protein
MRYTDVIGHGGNFWIREAGPGLGLWQGSYHCEKRLWLRWHDIYGNWIPTDAEQAQSRAEQMKKAALLHEAQLCRCAEQGEQVAEQGRQRAGRLVELLRLLSQYQDQA